MSYLCENLKSEEPLGNEQGREVTSSERKTKASAFSNLKDRARTLSHNVIPHINNYRKRYNFSATVQVQAAKTDQLECQDSAIDLRNEEQVRYF